MVLAKGEADVNGVRLKERDGLAINSGSAIQIKSGAESEVLLVDAP
jgi:redox-sensitive bicupin YhaK (pirin superfamily)